MQKLEQSLKKVIKNELSPFIETTKGRKKKRTEKKKSSSTGVELSFTNYSSHRVQAVKDITSAIQSIDIDALSFKELRGLSKFLIKFSKYLAVIKEEDILVFEEKIQALKNRNTELDLQASTIDWENFETTYSSNSKKLINLLAKVDLAPKGTKSHKLSKVFLSLADTVIDYAKLTSNNDNILTEIEAILDEERKNSKLYFAWKSMKGIQNEETDSEDSSSDEENSSDLWMNSPRV